MSQNIKALQQNEHIVITETKTYTVKKFRIRVDKMELNTSISLFVELLGDNDVLLGIRRYKVEGTDYTAWKSRSDGDTYLMHYVHKQLKPDYVIPSA